MKTLTITFAALLLLDGAAAADPVKLTTDSGVLVGRLEDGVRVFKGVPYAQPPVGPLRWRAPQRISWSGERDATRYALPCPQATPPDGRNNGGGVSGPSSEDCLYLNVWAPQDAKNAPVMLFLYGGAGYLGAGSLSTYDGSSFAKDGVILVTINYRLGMLGQFAHPALTKGQSDEGLANYQLMDAIAALDWVQRNGKALGADTNNVTIFGQSAGAVLTAALLSSPPARGKFHKAIIQSAVPQLGGGRTLAQAEADGVKFAQTLGLPGAEATAEQLRALPVDRVISSEARGPGFSNGSYLIIDGKIRTKTTGAGFADGTTVDVPLITGSNHAEFFGAEATRMVELAAKTGKAAAWQYYFTYVPEWLKPEQPQGAPHSAELPYVFDTLAISPRGGPRVTDADRSVARRMHSCWVSFAKASVTAQEIRCADGFVWPARTAVNDALAVFAETPSVAKAQPIIAQNALAFPARPGIGEP